MPAVPLQASPSHVAPTPKHTAQSASDSAKASISAEPSPAIVQASSHVETHIIARRFLGPMPETVLNSKEAEIKKRRFRQLRKTALRKIKLVDEEGRRRGSRDFPNGFGEGSSHHRHHNGHGDGHSGEVRRMVHRIRLRRRGHSGEVIDEDLDFDLELDSDSDSSSEDEDEGRGHPSRSSRKNTKKKKKKKKQKKNWTDWKEVWVGESFNIGQEFVSSRSQPSGSSSFGPLESPSPSTRLEEEGTDEDLVVDSPLEYSGSPFASSSAGVNDKRPSYTSKSTQETFVTARTELSELASTSTVNLPQSQDDNADLHQGNHSDTASLVQPVNLRNSQSSSVRPLWNGPERHSASDDQTTYPDSPISMKSRSRRDGSASPMTRLKSAIRKPHTLVDRPSTSPRDEHPFMPLNKSKSVQFPMNPVQEPGSHSPNAPVRTGELAGNKEPAAPEAVLAREGTRAAGTSAGAAEEAMHEQEEDEEDDEDDILPGDVIMRDRMLVRVGYHRDDGLAFYDEATQRRDPCSRMEPMEEYIVVWRKGRVELYQSWDNPLQERLRSHKRLCFVIPLQPTRTTLCMFNEVDMSISLTTSAGKLQHDVDALMKANTTRSGALRDRIKQSKQAQWLSTGRRGTHVFILNVGTRSRSVDWYWELWRDLGGELPTRIDVNVPHLSTVIRLNIPEDEDSVGGKATRAMLNPEAATKTCWDLLRDVVDMKDLMEQRGEREQALVLKLAWKALDGNLEWIAHDTTVEGKVRDWAVLAGMAKGTTGPHICELQLRPAQHQPQTLKLEDGTALHEPPGVEGYLVRQKSSVAPKESVYVSSHDGTLFISTIKEAHPPVQPEKAGSTPSVLFPEVHRAFLDSEQKRLALGIERSTGCVDLRSITSIRLCEKHTDEQRDQTSRSDDQMDHAADTTDQPNGEAKSKHCFEIELSSGEVVKLRAHSRDVAREWVDCLSKLIEYWKRKHRVDARLRMDAMKTRTDNDPFSGTSLSSTLDGSLSVLWDWCVVAGCRSVCLSGRLFMKKGRNEKFRAKYLVLTGGCLVAFKIKSKAVFQPRRNRYPLYGAYVYSGMLAQDEVREAASGSALESTARVYQDGFQSSDGAEDTTFCVRLSAPTSRWGSKRTNPWDLEPEASFLPPNLSKKPPGLLIFRARSKLERDRWVWAINAEIERQVRLHVDAENSLRMVGKVPDR